MTAVWLTIGALCAGTALLKASGPLALGSRTPSQRALAVIALVAPAVLAGLITYQTLTPGDPGLQLDARLVGLATAAAGLALRLPMLAVVALATVATALVRALT